MLYQEALYIFLLAAAIHFFQQIKNESILDCSLRPGIFEAELW